MTKCSSFRGRPVSATLLCRWDKGQAGFSSQKNPDGELMSHPFPFFAAIILAFYGRSDGDNFKFNMNSFNALSKTAGAGGE